MHNSIFLFVLLIPTTLSYTEIVTDEQCLTANLYFEARGEGEAGMRAVSDVVINRTKHKAFKGQDTVCKVVFAKGQFSWTKQHPRKLITKLLNGDLRGLKPKDILAYQKANKIAKQSLSNDPKSTLPRWVINFHTVQINPTWATNMKKYATIGQHVFYGFKKKG